VLSSSYFGGKQISNYAFSVDIAGGEFQNLVKKSHFAVTPSFKGVQSFMAKCIPTPCPLLV